jgi:hypothetical protein
MPVTAMRILVAGALPKGAVEMLRRFGDRGWGSRQVVTLQQARDQVGTYDFDVVLATEALCDGRGYDLAEPVARHLRTLLVGVALTESCLWLPVVERGVGVLGRRALNPQMLESEMEKIMRASALDNVRDISSKATFAGARPSPQGPKTLQHASTTQRSTTLRRKYRDRNVESA